MELRFTADDYNILLQRVDLSPAPERALRAGMVEGMVLRFEMSTEVASELMVDMMNAAIAVVDRQLCGTLERLVRKLADELGHQGMEFEVDPVGLIRRQNSYNRAPQTQLGGLSPKEVHQLLVCDWKPGSPGLQLCAEVPPDLLTGSDILANARVLLAALMPHGTRATEAGNLNRRFVGDMLAAMRWPAGFLEDLHHFNKVINEQDVGPLHDLRLVLELAKLLVRRKGMFCLTRKGRAMATEERAGALFTLLFETTFRSLNLAYRDRLPELPEFQGTIAFPLAVLAREPAGWLPYHRLVPRLLLPSLADQLPTGDVLDYREFLVRLRLLERLHDFGLVEFLWQEDRRWPRRYIRKVRRTRLFDRFLRVELA